MLEAPQDGKRHRRKPNRMSDAEIIVILIHFHSGGFRCFKHYYLHYICKHCKHLSHKTVDLYFQYIVMIFVNAQPMSHTHYRCSRQLLKQVLKE